MINQLKNKLIKNILMLITLIVFSVNLYANEKNKFHTTYPFMYESPTRFIIIVDHCAGDIGCPDVTYYEINKKTGNFLKLKGKTLNGPLSSGFAFKGYAFTYKDLNYTMYLFFIKNPSLEITKEGGDKTIASEPLIHCFFKTD